MIVLYTCMRLFASDLSNSFSRCDDRLTFVGSRFRDTNACLYSFLDRFFCLYCAECVDCFVHRLVFLRPERTLVDMMSGFATWDREFAYWTFNVSDGM